MSSRNTFVKVLLLTVVLALSIQSAWSQSVLVAPATSNVTAGGAPFDVVVQIDGVSNLQASHVEFAFDNTVVRYNGITRGAVMDGGIDVFQAAPPPGPSVDEVTVDQAVMGSTPFTGSGSLFTISFIPLKGGTSPVDLTVTLRDPANNTITTTITHGQVNVSNPSPTLTSIDPTTKVVGDAEFTLTLNGTNFVSGVSVVNLNGSPRTTQFVSSTQLTVTIPASDLLTAGDKSMTVVNDAPGGGTSLPQTLTVNKAATTTAVSGSPNPSFSGQSVLFTATVTPSAATGIVEFFDGATSLGTGALSSGTATLSASALNVGVHSNIKAVYGGDANYVGSENTTTQTVNPIITASAGPNGSISPSGIVPVALNGSQTFTFSPDLHYHVADVVVDANPQGPLPSVTFDVVTQNHTISVSFGITTYTLNVTVIGSGAVSVNPPTGPYVEGTVVTLTATADPGFTFTGWSGNATGGANPLDVTMDGNKNITATFSADAYTVTVSGVNGTVTKNPDKTNYAYSELVTLTAVPATGYHFVNWSGDASGSVNPLGITVDANKNIVANFEINSYTLTVNQNGLGTVTKAPDQPIYTHGASVVLSAVPGPGYSFAGWTGDVASSDNPLDVTMNGNKTITATFTQNAYTINIAAVNGTVTKSPDQPTYTFNQIVELTAVPNAGYSFTSWSGGASGTSNPVSITMDGNKNVTANFSQLSYALTLITSGSGSVTKDPDMGLYSHGSTVTLTANPATGWTFTGWTGDATGTTNPLVVTMDAAKSITATFTQNAFALTVNTVGTGTVTKDPNQDTYNHGATVQLTANAGTGYTFTGWSGDLAGTTNPAYLLMDGPKSVTATFGIKRYTITVTAGTHGTITPPGPTMVNHGDNQIYTITPETGYHTVDVKVDNVSQGAITSYEFINVTADRSIEATFAVNSYTITVSAGDNGSIVPAGPNVSVNHGENQLFTMSPAIGYHVASLTIDGVRVNPAATYTFSGVADDHSIGVTFAVDEYAISGPTEYNLDVDGNSATDMKVNVGAKPAGGATISAIAYVTPPAGAPALPPNALPLYLDLSSTLPDHAHASTVRLDLNGITGFGPSSVLAYYNEVTSSWVLIEGTYLASDPLFGSHPSFTFQADHFGTFTFFNPPAAPLHMYGSASPSVAAQATIYPNNAWRPAGPTYGGADDWSWSGSQAVSIYLVPQVGSQFGSADITLEWDPAQMSFGIVDFGSAPAGLYGSGAGYTPSTTVTEPYGPGRVKIQCTRGDNGNFTTTAGQYIARVNFTLLKPGHTPVAIIGANFTTLPETTPAYFFPMQAEVKTYLADITSLGNVNTGDGKVDFEDLTAWTYSYWVGVPGYSGGAPYKVKDDFGPTSDNYVFTLPQPDGKIDFEDLLIFSLGYGQTAGKYLPKVAPGSTQPVEISLGAPVANGIEVAIPVLLGGSVSDVRGLSLELNGQFGAFLGADAGELIKSYASPVPLLQRSEGRSAYLDLAVMGLAAPGLDRPGEVVKLRFTGNPRIQLTRFEARDSRNMPVEMKKVKGAGEVEPTVFALLQNYPNPFNPTTTIEYQLPAHAMTNIEVYNMLGERVVTLVNEMQPAGFYTVQWNGTRDGGSKVATGVYFYRMRAENFTMVKKMLLVK